MNKLNMNKGFTLVELSIVLIIMSVVIGGSLTTFTASIKKTQFDLTSARIETIESALLSYSMTNLRIPCPADITKNLGDAAYATEGITCHNIATLPTTPIEGTIPTKELGLSDDYMYDGWGHRFRYAVDPAFTANITDTTNPPKTNPLPINSGGLCIKTTTGITVKDSTATARTTSAIYTIVSQGVDGHGGYTYNGSLFNGSLSNTDELKNCHCNSSAVASATDGIYVQKAPTYTSATDQFDDIVAFKEAWQMQSQSFTLLPAPACIYISDQGASAGNKVQQYNEKPNNWNSLTDPTVPIVAQSRMITDSNGYLFLTTANNVQKSTDGGVTWTNIISGLANANGIYIDDSNNMWILDGNNLKKYSSAYALQSTLPASLAMNLPSSVYGDTNGNMWIADTGNNQLQKYNIAGNSWNQYGSLGTAAGYFNAPSGIYVDAQGNIWIADKGNNRIQRCNSTITSCTTFGGTTTGTGNGEFNQPWDIKGDADGNIYVTDLGNLRIQKYSNGNWSIFAMSGSAGNFIQPRAIAVSR
ncbi:MAG: prepilin-type N-terminal cleavage/methylation domain-containing protein [Pseudomonadota bacterium]